AASKINAAVSALGHLELDVELEVLEPRQGDNINITLVAVGEDAALATPAKLFALLARPPSPEAIFGEQLHGRPPLPLAVSFDGQGISPIGDDHFPRDEVSPDIALEARRLGRRPGILGGKVEANCFPGDANIPQLDLLPFRVDSLGAEASSFIP